MTYKTKQRILRDVFAAVGLIGIFLAICFADSDLLPTWIQFTGMAIGVIMVGVGYNRAVDFGREYQRLKDIDALKQYFRRRTER